MKQADIVELPPFSTEQTSQPDDLDKDDLVCAIQDLIQRLRECDPIKCLK